MRCIPCFPIQQRRNGVISPEQASSLLAHVTCEAAGTQSLFLVHICLRTYQIAVDCIV